MAKIFPNPDNLKVEIDAIRTLAALCSTARTNIDNESAAEHDPYEGIEDFLSESSPKIETVNERADSIESAMNTIIELSENGVAPMDVDGTITVTAPDAVVAGGITEFDAWAQGAIDAAELTSAPGSDPPPSGRTRDEIIASIEANQNSTAYSLEFIDTAGPANLTRIPLTFAPSTGSTSPHDDTDAQSEQAEISRADRTALATAGMLNEIGESDATLSEAALADIGEVLAVYAPGVDRSIQSAGEVSGSTVSTYVETPDSFGEF